MTQRSKTHYEEVPLEVAQKIAEEQFPVQPLRAIRSEQCRRPIRKRPSKGLKPDPKILRKKEDS